MLAHQPMIGGRTGPWARPADRRAFALRWCRVRDGEGFPDRHRHRPAQRAHPTWSSRTSRPGAASRANLSPANILATASRIGGPSDTSGLDCRACVLPVVFRPISRCWIRSQRATPPRSAADRRGAGPVGQVRRAAQRVLPAVPGRRRAGDDGRQRRARHHLLGDLGEVPLPGADRLRGHQPLAAVPAALALLRRARRPLRLPQADPGVAGAVHGGLADLGRSCSSPTR